MNNQHKQMNNQRNLGLLLVLMVIFTVMRWPGLLPWNFSPVYAIFLCAGVFFKDRRMWLVPVVLMFVSDVFMNYFHWRLQKFSVQEFSVFSPGMLANYILYLGLAMLGCLITDKRPAAILVAGGMLGACGFFFASNVMAWMGNPIYSKTWAGLIQSFTVGQSPFPPPIIFLKNTALSGALFTAIIVYAVRYARASEKSEEEFQLKT